MKITKVQTPPKDIAQFSGANYPVEDEGINPEDVVEIFNTPLTGSYNWDYTVQDNRIRKLYELGKEKNWNVEEDINWNVPNPDADETAFMFFNEQWKDHKDYKNLSIEQRKEFVQDLNNWTLAQLLHGEQGALLVASQLTSCAPTFNAKLYAASQTFDEARHVEAFNKYLQTRVGRMFPIGANLKALLDKVLTDLINPVPSKLSFRDFSVSSKFKSLLKYPLSSTAVSNKILYPLPISLLFNKRGTTRFLPPPMVGPVIPSTWV